MMMTSTCRDIKVADQLLAHVRMICIRNPQHRADGLRQPSHELDLMALQSFTLEGGLDATRQHLQRSHNKTASEAMFRGCLNLLSLQPIVVAEPVSGNQLTLFE
jgi:hypothetical protein